LFIEWALRPLMYLILQSSYKTEDPNDVNYYNGKIYHKKLCISGYKMIYFIFISVVSFNILKQLNFFPTTLGGSGQVVNMLEAGFPEYFFFWKPDYFNIYYLANLSYHLTDLIWLVFFYELQNDFVMMILHHICTVSLIVFSYMSNYSNVGSIVMFLHDFSDIFVYLIRIVINTDAPKALKVASAVVLLIVFIYTRIYVFGHLLYTLLVQFVYRLGWNYMSAPLFIFLTFLYVMHIYWVYAILKKMAAAVFKDKIEDTCKVKKIR
jgi:hypothetical protein